jgi:hypothetical protein
MTEQDEDFLRQQIGRLTSIHEKLMGLSRGAGRSALAMRASLDLSNETIDKLEEELSNTENGLAGEERRLIILSVLIKRVADSVMNTHDSCIKIIGREPRPNKEGNAE